MLACRVRCAGLFLLVLLLSGVTALAQEKEKEKPAEKFPSKEEVADLLKREPMTQENWPKWRERLLAWIFDRGQGTDPAFEEARKLVRGQVDDKDELPEPFAKDHLAWYLLGASYHLQPGQDEKAALSKAEKAFRRSLLLDPKLPHAHMRLAIVLLAQEPTAVPPQGADASDRFKEALKELDEAAKLSDQVPVGHVRGQAGQVAGNQRRFDQAEELLLRALREDPGLVPQLLDSAAIAVLRNPKRDYRSSGEELKKLAVSHPKNGVVAASLAFAYFAIDENEKSAAEFARARALGTDSAQVLPRELRLRIGQQLLDVENRQIAVTFPHILFLHEQFPNDKVIADMYARALVRHPKRSYAEVYPDLRKLADQYPDDGALACYLALSLDDQGDGPGALAELARARQLGAKPEDIIGGSAAEIEQNARVHQFQHTMYWLFGGGFGFFILVMGLMAVGAARPTKEAPLPSRQPLVFGLWLFYAALAFMVVAIVLLDIGLVVLLFSLPRARLFIIGAVTNILFGMAIDLFIRRADNHPGIACDATEAVELQKLVTESATSVNGEPIAAVRLSPGAEVAIYPAAPRLFGLLGSRQRVLSIGYLALRLLTVSELRAMLAQRFARLRKDDTAADQFLERHIQAIDESLAGIWAYGGKTNYFNPFFLFLLLYYKCFQRFAAGYLRSRELRADRLAAEQHGGDATAEAIRKLSVDAPILEQRLKKLVQELTTQDPELGNMYAAWDDLCGPEASGEDAKEFAHLAFNDQQRTAARQKALDDEQSGIAANRPSLKERMDALTSVPNTSQPRNQPAVDLLDNREHWEEQLTTVGLENWNKQKVATAPVATAK
jgi:tetratricopeptide (TPR) repeat protein